MWLSEAEGESKGEGAKRAEPPSPVWMMLWSSISMDHTCLCQDGLFRATAAADVKIQDHCLVHHTDHPLHLKYNSVMMEFGHVPQLSVSSCCAPPQLCSCFSSRQAVSQTHNCKMSVCDIIVFCGMLIRFVNDLWNLLLPTEVSYKWNYIIILHSYFNVASCTSFT